MMTYQFNTPAAIAMAEVIIHLSVDFAKKRNQQGIDSLLDLTAELIMDNSDSYVSFIDLKLYLEQINDALESKILDPIAADGVIRERKNVEENLKDARQAYSKLVGADELIAKFLDKPQA